jgi:secreted trypsin-like serine protease
MFLGDSGGGFYRKEANGWYLYGIVSTGVIRNGDCDTGKLVVYTDVPKFNGWVKNGKKIIIF